MEEDLNAILEEADTDKVGSFNFEQVEELLLTTDYCLLTADHVLPDTCYWLPTTDYRLLTADY